MTNRTPISVLGKVAFTECLTSWATNDIIKAIGDDAAVIDRGDDFELLTTASMIEGVDFSLAYFPLEHLGQKLVTKAVSNIYAMNGVARWITITVGFSARFAIEDAQALYRGVEAACSRYDVQLIGGNTSSSVSGLVMSATVVGSVDKSRVAFRSGASAGDLICSTGSLGHAYMGLQLLERERRAGGEPLREVFEKHRSLISAQLNPYARLDVIEMLEEYDIVPSSMIDITSGLASAVLSICHASDVGARIFLNKLPIGVAVSEMAEELNFDPLIAVLNGGDDYELLFTAPVSAHEELSKMPDINVIGHVSSPSEGAVMVSPDGSEIGLTSPDFTQTPCQ